MLNTPTGSSLYPVNTESEFVDAGDRYIYPVRETVIGTRKLEEVLDEQRVEGVDIIKLDVQGAELEILQGLGAARRKRLLLAELEINISGGVTRNFSTYRGAPSWLDCERLLAEDGMRLLDISVARSYRPTKATTTGISARCSMSTETRLRLRHMRGRPTRYTSGTGAR